MVIPAPIVNVSPELSKLLVVVPSKSILASSTLNRLPRSKSLSSRIIRPVPSITALFGAVVKTPLDDKLAVPPPLSVNKSSPLMVRLLPKSMIELPSRPLAALPSITALKSSVSKGANRPSEAKSNVPGPSSTIFWASPITTKPGPSKTVSVSPKLLRLPSSRIPFSMLWTLPRI